MIEDKSEEMQNCELKSVKLLRELSGRKLLYTSLDLDKVILGDFCIAPKCLECPENKANAEECVHDRSKLKVQYICNGHISFISFIFMQCCPIVESC
jgi:hypothetical protein